MRGEIGGEGRNKIKKRRKEDVERYNGKGMKCCAETSSKYAKHEAR
jgi:hypothetical protein